MYELSSQPILASSADHRPPCRPASRAEAQASSGAVRASPTPMLANDVRRPLAAGLGLVDLRPGEMTTGDDRAVDIVLGDEDHGRDDGRDRGRAVGDHL